MGRPKRYTTAAERQAAYRHRLSTTTVPVDRQRLDQVDRRYAELQEALAPWAQHGAPFARRLYRSSLPDTLAIVAQWFRERKEDETATPV